MSIALSPVVFIDPSREQLHLVRELANGREVIAVPLENEVAGDGSLCIVSAEELLTLARRDGESWHCCSELAVYFASKHRARAGRLPFHARCFDMLTKLEAAEIMATHGLPHVPKLEPGTPFPFVAKPNFGFATRLVRRISDESQWHDYVDSFDAMREQALIGFYAREYFDYVPPERLSRIVIEPDLSAARFVTIVLAVDGGALRAAFSVEAYQKLDNHLSDFTWGGFLAPLRWSEALQQRVDATLVATVAAFCTGSGVFELEMLVDMASEQHWILEFSPRITGGNIPRLLRHAYGVDIERANVEYALDGHPDLTVHTGPVHLLQRTIAEHTPHDDVIESHSVQCDGVAYIDSVLLAPKPVFDARV